MPRFIESIKLLDGKFYNLDLHEQRRNKTSLKFFGRYPAQSLTEIMDLHSVPAKGHYKCRVLYDGENSQLQLVPYKMKKIHSLKVVKCDVIDYSHKFENRSELNALYSQRIECDDIIIVKDGFVTDASYANIIFKFGNNWITPATFLLNGVMRQHLLAEGKIKQDEIRVNDLSKFDCVKLINALLGMDGNEAPMNKVFV